MAARLATAWGRRPAAESERRLVTAMGSPSVQGWEQSSVQYWAESSRRQGPGWPAAGAVIVGASRQTSSGVVDTRKPRGSAMTAKSAFELPSRWLDYRNQAAAALPL